MEDKLISIVVPMYFEEQVAEECYKRLTNVAMEHELNYELIFVNDGSTDNTLNILRGLAEVDKRVKVINFSRNFGHQIAITAGMDKAKGEAVIIIDADLQDPPELIPDMINLWKNGYEVVYAKRKKRDGETWFKLATAKAFYRFLNKMSTVTIPVDTGDFRLIDRKVIDTLKKMPEKNRYVRGMVSWIGFKQTAIEYERKERFAGETKYPLKKMIKFAMDGILSFSSKPIKFIENLGVFSIVLSFFILIICILGNILMPELLPIGWISIMTTIFFIGGVQLLSIGVLGEYITRIHDESKSRPLYIIEHEINTEEIYEVSKEIVLEEQLQKKVG
jgi:polyisoprenyl-phosphate glycosyltransferase